MAIYSSASVYEGIIQLTPFSFDVGVARHGCVPRGDVPSGESLRSYNVRPAREQGQTGFHFSPDDPPRVRPRLTMGRPLLPLDGLCQHPQSRQEGPGRQPLPGADESGVVCVPTSLQAHPAHGHRRLLRLAVLSIGVLRSGGPE